MDASVRSDATGDITTSEPGFSLWDYQQALASNWKDAEVQLGRAARWLLIFAAAQVITMLNRGQFGPDAPTTTINSFMDIRVPGFYLAMALPLASTYWVSQYVHSWVATKVLTRTHGAVTARLIDPGNVHRQETTPKEIGGEGHRFSRDVVQLLASVFRLQEDSTARGVPGKEVEAIEAPLTPVFSVGGRLPTLFGKDWRDDFGTRWAGLVVVVAGYAFEGVAFGVLNPFGADHHVLLLTLTWLVSAFVSILFLWYAGGFTREPSRWQPARLIEMLTRLEHDGRIGR
jgi:hypothetical protein